MPVSGNNANNANNVNNESKAHSMTALDNLRAQHQINVDSVFAPSWVPKEGDVLVGRLVKVDSRKSDYDNEDGSSRFYPIVTVDTNVDEGAPGSDCLRSCTEDTKNDFGALHAQASKAKWQFRDSDAHIGDLIVISYEGKRKPTDSNGKAIKGRMEQHYYTVTADIDDRFIGERTPVDWAQWARSKDEVEGLGDVVSDDDELDDDGALV